jgi:hypothetical protein
MVQRDNTLTEKTPSSRVVVVIVDKNESLVAVATKIVLTSFSFSKRKRHS